MTIFNGNGNGEDASHVKYAEFVCPDGYVSSKVPLKHIRVFDPDVTWGRIRGHPEKYASYREHVVNGRYANGVPIVYRTPKGSLFASDLRDSDMVIHAEQALLDELRPEVAVYRNKVHPMLSVKIIEVASREDIPVQRAAYLATNAASLVKAEKVL